MGGPCLLNSVFVLVDEIVVDLHGTVATRPFQGLDDGCLASDFSFTARRFSARGCCRCGAAGWGHGPHARRPEGGNRLAPWGVRSDAPREGFPKGLLARDVP